MPGDKGDMVRARKGFNQEKMKEQARLMYEDRLNDMSIRQIAKKHRCSVDTVMRRLKDYEAIPEITVYQWREFEREKLDEMENEILTLMGKKHYRVDHGRLIFLDEMGMSEPLEDSEMVLKCIDRLIKIHEKRTRLFGLEAPSQQEITVSHEIKDQELLDVLKRQKEQLEIEERQIIEAEIVEEES